MAEELQHELSKVDSIGTTYLVGCSPNQIRVEPDPERLSLYGITLSQLADKLTNANRSFLLGTFREQGRAVPVVAGQTLQGVPDIGLLLLTSRDELLFHLVLATMSIMLLITPAIGWREGVVVMVIITVTPPKKPPAPPGSDSSSTTLLQPRRKTRPQRDRTSRTSRATRPRSSPTSRRTSRARAGPKPTRAPPLPRFRTCRPAPGARRWRRATNTATSPRRPARRKSPAPAAWARPGREPRGHPISASASPGSSHK